MTTNERARQLAEALRPQVGRYVEDPVPLIREALRAAQLEAAEEFRERAAKVASDNSTPDGCLCESCQAIRGTADDIAAEIRCLPLSQTDER